MASVKIEITLSSGEKSLLIKEIPDESFTVLTPNWQESSVLAAKLYFDLRKKGVTIRKSTDCLIASIALQYDFLLVHNDTDFDLLAQNSHLRVLR